MSIECIEKSTKYLKPQYNEATMASLTFARTPCGVLAVISALSLLHATNSFKICPSSTIGYLPFHRHTLVTPPRSFSRVTLPCDGCRSEDAPTGISLRASLADSENDKINTSDELDISALLRYVVAGIVQIGSIAGVFKLFDLSGASAVLPVPGVIAMVYFLSLKSRIFNLLDNSRPDVETKGFGDRTAPSWTPPGVFFPIMWLLIIGPLRAYSTSLIFQSNGGVLCDPTILSFMFSLSIGDIWNTINNNERRLGAAVPGVLCVLVSTLFAANQYYLVDPTAGKLLGATALWIATASALIADTWRLNKRNDGSLAPLYPAVGEANTRFFFEEK
uniref:Uncharacterized protein n=1 Tax=Corethron hystrix TaxID=216773 RepID=A0A7S1FM29_9STRA|mmetsp:Transcript_12738/g.28107  ORF Transcript_12738/g.28107 Transcript_12738/m.28107 type:complete len:333 (+) Transcript_12738:75-1073(+)